MIESISNINIDEIWEKGKKIEGVDPNLFRLDICGAVMNRNKFNQRFDDYGWGIGLIYPQKYGGDYDPENIRPMNITNIESKGDDFPVYFGKMRAVDGFNRRVMQKYRVAPATIERLKKIYGENIMD